MNRQYFLNVDGNKISITKSASDKCPAIIFIHGASISSEFWESQLSDSSLSDNYLLYTIDLPGHGKSSWSKNPKKDYSIKGMGIILADVINELILKEYIIVTLSYSGNLIGESVNKLKGCKGILMAGPSIIGSELGLGSLIKEYPYMHLLTAPKATSKELKGFAKYQMHQPSEHNSRMAARNYEETDPAFRETLGEVLSRSDYSDEIQNLKQSGLPLAIVYGEQETIVKPNYLTEAGLRLWGNKIHLIEGGGHFVNIDQPEKFNELLTSFAKNIFKK